MSPVLATKGIACSYASPMTDGQRPPVVAIIPGNGVRNYERHGSHGYGRSQHVLALTYQCLCWGTDDANAWLVLAELLAAVRSKVGEHQLTQVSPVDQVASTKGVQWVAEIRVDVELTSSLDGTSTAEATTETVIVTPVQEITP